MTEYINKHMNERMNRYSYMKEGTTDQVMESVNERMPEYRASMDEGMNH